jgi:Flp pilus assembly pilin Flp
MGPANLDYRTHGLTEAQAKDLSTKLKSFWDELSPEEQTHLDFALTRLVNEAPDVTGHGLIEYAFVLQLIALLVIAP